MGTGRVLLPGVGNTGDTAETRLELAVVGGHKVGKSVQLGSELTLGGLESSLGSSGSTTEGSTLASNDDLLGEGGGHLGGGGLVRVEDRTELATGTLGLGVTHVGSVDDHGHLTVHTAVHTDLGLTVAHDLTRHDGDLTLKSGLGRLDLRR